MAEMTKDMISLLYVSNSEMSLLNAAVPYINMSVTCPYATRKISVIATEIFIINTA